MAEPRSLLCAQMSLYLQPVSCMLLKSGTRALLEGQSVLGHPTDLRGFKAMQGQLLQRKIPVGLFYPA